MTVDLNLNLPLYNLNDPAWYGRNTFIYFVQNSNGTGPIKIGLSDTPGKRLKSLQTGCPDPLSVKKLIRGDRQLESELHRYFWQDRIRGEWFQPSKKLVDYVRSLPDGRLRENRNGLRYCPNCDVDVRETSGKSRCVACNANLRQRKSYYCWVCGVSTTYRDRHIQQCSSEDKEKLPEHVHVEPVEEVKIEAVKIPFDEYMKEICRYPDWLPGLQNYDWNECGDVVIPKDISAVTGYPERVVLNDLTSGIIPVIKLGKRTIRVPKTALKKALDHVLELIHDLDTNYPVKMASVLDATIKCP